MEATTHWVQLVFITETTTAELLSDALEEAGSAAITLLDAADQALFDVGQKELEWWDQIRLIALFDAAINIDQILSLVKQKIPRLPPHEVLPLKDENWERAWMSRFKPMKFGQNLWICPSWETPPEPKDINLMLDPGMAFGTGTHETTSLCLTWLAEHAELIKDKTVVDYGCGSGILAIAAAKIGAESIWAVDIEQQSLNSTQENASNNQVLDIFTITGPDETKDIKANLFIANILANPLIKLAPLFAKYTELGGHIILSGILQEQIPDVLEAYTPFFTFKEPNCKNEWSLLEGARITQ